MLNTIVNLFVIMSSNRLRLCTLVDRFQAGNPAVVNADMYCLETFLEAIHVSLTSHGQPTHSQAVHALRLRPHYSSPVNIQPS